MCQRIVGLHIPTHDDDLRRWVGQDSLAVSRTGACRHLLEDHRGSDEDDGSARADDGAKVASLCCRGLASHSATNRHDVEAAECSARGSVVDVERDVDSSTAASSPEIVVFEGHVAGSFGGIEGPLAAELAENRIKLLGSCCCGITGIAVLVLDPLAFFVGPSPIIAPTTEHIAKGPSGFLAVGRHGGCRDGGCAFPAVGTLQSPLAAEGVGQHTEIYGDFCVVSRDGVTVPVGLCRDRWHQGKIGVDAERWARHGELRWRDGDGGLGVIWCDGNVPHS